MKNVINSNLVIINKQTIDKVFSYVKNSDFCLKQYGSASYVLSKDDFNKIKIKFCHMINDDLISSVSKISEANLDHLYNLYEEYISMYYDNVRNKFGKFDKRLYQDEEIINKGLEVLNEVDKIKSIPEIIDSIKRNIKEIEDNNLLVNIDDYKSKFNNLRRYSGSYESYISINKYLESIIIKTYIKKITDLTTLQATSDLNFVIKDSSDNVLLLTNDNLIDFDYGLIMNKKYISKAKSKSSNSKLESYNNIDKKNNKISLTKEKPLAIFAVTLGEKTLNENYLKALKLREKNKNLPLIEIDLMKYVSKESLQDKFYEFINNLLINKGLDYKNYPKEFYDKFDYFYKSYQELKTKDYCEENIINLFDFDFNLIFSSKYKDIDSLLSKDLSIEELKNILELNIYYDDNIFRYNCINEKLLGNFYNRYFPVKDNSKLNYIYPGINKILDLLTTMTFDELSIFIYKFNSIKTKDSWLISELMKPTHTQNKIEINVNISNEQQEDNDEKLKDIYNTMVFTLPLTSYIR